MIGIGIGLWNLVKSKFGIYSLTILAVSGVLWTTFVLPKVEEIKNLHKENAAVRQTVVIKSDSIKIMTVQLDSMVQNVAVASEQLQSFQGLIKSYEVQRKACEASKTVSENKLKYLIETGNVPPCDTVWVAVSNGILGLGKVRYKIIPKPPNL